MSVLEISAELKAMIPFKRRVELDRIPKALWPADHKRGDLYRAFSYTTAEVATAWQAFYETVFGAVLAADFVIPASGRIVHLYRLDKAMVSQVTQEFRDERQAQRDSSLASRMPV